MREEKKNDTQQIQYNNLYLAFHMMNGILGGTCNGYNGAVVAGALMYLDKDFPEITIT